MHIDGSNSRPPFSFAHLTPAEARLFAALVQGNDWLRALLCTLARRGLAYRDANAARAQEILGLLAPWPLYKAGQFLFDLMEWEDFMLDGPPPPVLSGALDAAALEKLAELLRSVPGYLDGSNSGGQPVTMAAPGEFTAVDDANLPELQPALTLYQDVMLGAVYSVILAQSQSDGASPADDNAP